ncbi:MAG TPA: glycosyltransferase, partial [Blastocatellia bacterium]|nr:glycosyltransferase [Blastocatellia bacterium]
NNGVQLECVIVGDGPDRDQLTQQARELGVSDHIKFTGALPFNEALEWYEWAHCLVLPSKHSEGWPKVVAEAMCYGLICIAVDHGQVPAMLRGRGILLPNGTGQEIAEAIKAIAENPAVFQVMMREAAEWSKQFSLEGLRDAIAALLEKQWNVPRFRVQNQTSNVRAQAMSTTR